MNCLHCKTINENGTNFCKNCGKRISPEINTKPYQSVYIYAIVICIANATIGKAMAVLLLNEHIYMYDLVALPIFIFIELIPILLGFFITKNKNLRLVLLIVTTILIVLHRIISIACLHYLSNSQ